ncbi:MAG: UDP-N-acetylmuramoyl-L-alanine--D-glutamate ligase [Bacteriovoracales bacterium]
MNLSDKKVAVYGMGKSGISALRLLSREKAKTFAVSKGDPKNWYPSINKFIPIDNCFDENDPKAAEIFSNSDIIILSPGIPTTNECLSKAIGSVPIWSEVELGFHFSKVPVIAITGTNGKTTTVSLLGELLTSAGYKVFVGGNIGIPYCDISFNQEKYDFAVLEISSFQLEQIESFKPHLAAILNVTQNHGERYKTFKEYREAKENIARNLTGEDFLIVPTSDDLLVKWAKSLPSKLVEVDPRKISEMESIWDLSKFQLIGNHNLINLYFCFKILKSLGIDPVKAKSGMENFRGVDFRLQKEDTKYPFEVFNDAKSTNYDATLTALKSLSEKKVPIYLILGGQNRGIGDSITGQIPELKKYVKKIFLIGQTTEMLAQELKDQIPNEKSLTIERAIEEVKNDKNFKGILLFSPAFPSFDQFENYVVRGKSFSKLIHR